MIDQMQMTGGAFVPPVSVRDAFVENAEALGAKVCRDALWASDRCNWIGPIMEPLGGRWRQVHKMAGPEFYGGTSGIAYSLAALYEASGERVFKKTSLGAIRHSLARRADIDSQMRHGLYSGWFGISFAALNIARALDTETLQAESRELVRQLTQDLLKNDLDPNNLDLLAGYAGSIIGLLQLRKYVSDEALMAAALRVGDHLIATAVKAEPGWSWGDLHKPESGAFGNLLGYSHGAGGIGWALLELYAVTNETRFREAGESAFRYERHWFDPQTGNWPDLRNPELAGVPKTDQPSFMNAWCHGAPGVALSRLRAYEILDCQTCRVEAETAINTTLNNLFGNTEMSQTNYSLCHGFGGNCEPLIYGAAVLKRPELLTQPEQVGLGGIQSYQAQRLSWPCGGPGNLEAAGLMLGLAGISYFYLRLANPEKVPSVLVMSPRFNYEIGAGSFASSIQN